MLDAEKWAKVKGFNAAYLISYTKTEDFYKKCNYKEIKSGYNLGMFKRNYEINLNINLLVFLILFV